MTTTAEQADLLESLRRHRSFLLVTVQGLTDEQAATRSTVSELTLGGLVSHVTQIEQQWADFIVDGPSTAPVPDWEAVDWSNPPPDVQAYLDSHRMLEGQTLAGLLEAYDAVAARTDALVTTVDLDAAQPLPVAPWFEPGASWTARRVLLHLIAETAQHCGHADIIREAIDGQKTMG
jgi:hypothetical protein